jgi:Fe-S-cluster containining protein
MTFELIKIMQSNACPCFDLFGDRTPGRGEVTLAASPTACAGPGVCAQCASLGQTCCQLAPGNEEACFPLSTMEKDRILEAAPRLGGFCLSPNSAAFLAMLRRLFPGEARALAHQFPPDKEHWRLATLPSGDCAFLSPSGCILPKEARPYYCRLFPFWVMEDDVTVFTAGYCLAVKQGKNVAGTLEATGITRKRVHELFGRLRLAWGLIPALTRFPK